MSSTAGFSIGIRGIILSLHIIEKCLVSSVVDLVNYSASGKGTVLKLPPSPIPAMPVFEPGPGG